MDTFILIFEIIGTVAFAISGAVKGIKRGMDLFGVAILGLVTGVGGGVIRDTVLGNTPALAFKSPLFAIIALSCAILTFIIIGLVGKRITTELKNYERNILFLADTIGLAVFTMTGARIAEESSAKNITATIFIGVITAVGGGILRDVFLYRGARRFQKTRLCRSVCGGCAHILDCGPIFTRMDCGCLRVLYNRTTQVFGGALPMEFTKS